MSCFMHASKGFVPTVERSLRPTPRPENLNTTRSVKDGEFQNGKVKLSINLYDGIFHQRNEREYLIPVIEYFKNEYPQLNFNEIKLKSLNINSKTLSDFAYTRFYNDQGTMLKEVLIPRYQDPNVVFGDYINASIKGNEVRDLLYVGISGVQNINNITAYFEKGSSNFSQKISAMPTQGSYVGAYEGLKSSEFNESTYQLIMNEVYKMSEVQYPERTSSWDNNDWDNGYNDWNNDDDWYQPSRPEYSEPSPEVVPYRPNQGTQLYYNRRLSVAVGSVGLFGKRLTLQMTSGSADLVGYEVLKSNGKTKTRELVQRLDAFYSNQVEITLSTFDSNGTVTFIFSNASQDASAYVLEGSN